MDRFAFLWETGIPCLFKKYLGVECPGCGFQRSLWALMDGCLWDSFYLYPALVPILATLLFMASHLLFKFSQGHRVLVFLFVLSTLLIFGNYFAKQWGLVGM